MARLMLVALVALAGVAAVAAAADAAAAAADVAPVVDAAAADVALGASDVAAGAADVAKGAADVATIAKDAPAIVSAVGAGAAAAKKAVEASASGLKSAVAADAAALAQTVGSGAAGVAAAALKNAATLKGSVASDAAEVKNAVTADVGGIKAALLAAAADVKKAVAAAAASADGGPALTVTTTPAPVAPAAAAASGDLKFDFDSLVNFAQSLNLTQVKGIADKATALKEAAGTLDLGSLDVKNLTSVLSTLGRLPETAKGLGIDIRLPEVPAIEKIDVDQVVSLFNTAKVLIPKVNLTSAAGAAAETKAGEAARSVVKALLWKQRVQAASMQLASSVALGILTEGVSGMHNVSMGVAQKALAAVGMKQALAGAGLASSMGVLKRAKQELDEELVAKLRNSTALLGDLSAAVQKQAADGTNFATSMFVQLCNTKIDQLKLALAGKPVTPGLGEGLLWTPGTLPKPVYAAAAAPKPTAACAAACEGEAREPVCTGKRQTWDNKCLAACVGARIINPGACPPIVIGTA